MKRALILAPLALSVLLLFAGCQSKSVRVRYMDGSEQRYETSWSLRKIQNRTWIRPDVREIEIVDHNLKTIYHYRRPQ